MKLILVTFATVLVFIGCKNVESSNKYNSILTNYEKFADSVGALSPKNGFTMEETTQITDRSAEFQKEWDSLVASAKNDDDKPSVEQLKRLGKCSHKVVESLYSNLMK